MDTTLEKPTSLALAQSKMAVHKAPEDVVRAVLTSAAQVSASA
jgi:hypothetical protein